MGRTVNTIPGININWPWSQLILSGSKTIETRHYPLPLHYIGVPLAIIETPGPKGKPQGIKTSIVGVVTFSRCFKYENQKHWKKDLGEHLVQSSDDDYRYIEGKDKYGWVVSSVIKFENKRPAPKVRGIIFAKACEI